MTTIPASRLNGHSEELLNPAFVETVFEPQEKIDFSAEPEPYRMSEPPRFCEAGIDEEIEISTGNIDDPEEARLRVRAFLREYAIRVIRVLRSKEKERKQINDFPETLIYVSHIPKETVPGAFHLPSPKCSHSLSYKAAAECAAAMNREIIQENGEPVGTWVLCVRNHKKFATLRIPLEQVWTPRNEYDMPPTDIVERCSLTTLKEKLSTINQVISKLNPNRLSVRWAVAAYRIHPDDVQRETDRCQASHDEHDRTYGGTEEAESYSVFLENGLPLRHGYDRTEAGSFVNRWNLLRSEDEPRAFVKPINPKPVEAPQQPTGGRYDVITSAGHILQTGLSRSNADRYVDLHNNLNHNAENRATVQTSVA